VGAGIPTIPAECAAAQHAWGRAHAGALLRANCSVKVRGSPGRDSDTARHACQRRHTSAHARKHGLQQRQTHPRRAADTTVCRRPPPQELLPPDEVAAGTYCQPFDVALVVTFASKQQAAQRAGEREWRAVASSGAVRYAVCMLPAWASACLRPASPVPRCSSCCCCCVHVHRLPHTHSAAGSIHVRRSVGSVCPPADSAGEPLGSSLPRVDGTRRRDC
jgi:hypothetical protein